MRDARTIHFGLIAAALAIGWLAWSGVYVLMPLIVIVPALWLAAPSRLVAWLVAVAYFVGATHALFRSSALFFGFGISGGLVLWAASALFHSAIWGVCWARNVRARAFALAAVLIISAVPPLGVICWNHPLDAAGPLFPHFGMLGFACTYMLILSLAFALDFARFRVLALALIILSGFAHIFARPVTQILAWRGYDTHFQSNAAAAPDFLRQFDEQQQLISTANKGSRIAVFPEISSGEWTTTTADLWSGTLHPGHVALLGAITSDSNGKQYDNVIVAVDSSGANVVYKQRLPSPVSMWQPWSSSGARAHWFKQAVIRVEGFTVAPMICHEQFLVWVAASSLFAHPQAIVATGNVWWAVGTEEPNIQRNIVRAWADLAGIPAITAFNR